MVMQLTRKGIFKYGLVLCIVEISTLGSIFMFKLMIDFLQSPNESSKEYAAGIFAAFCILRLITVFSRSYFDLHVYNYFRFVQTQIQCWLFELVCGLKQWQVKEEKKAQVVYILTKDIDIFVNGSYMFPYLVTVPINTIISAIFLFSMYHYIVLVCYLAILLLLVMQYFTNKYIAKLLYKSLTLADKRIQFLSQLLKGIRTIKCRVLE